MKQCLSLLFLKQWQWFRWLITIFVDFGMIDNIEISISKSAIHFIYCIFCTFLPLAIIFWNQVKTYRLHWKIHFAIKELQCLIGILRYDAFCPVRQMCTGRRMCSLWLDGRTGFVEVFLLEGDFFGGVFLRRGLTLHVFSCLILSNNFLCESLSQSFPWLYEISQWVVSKWSGKVSIHQWKAGL